MLVAAPWHTADAAREKIAVLGVEPRDDGDSRSQQRTAALARALTDAVRKRAVAAGTGYELAAGTQKELLEVKLLNDCIDEAPECMAAIGRDLDADVLLFGNIERRKSGEVAVWLRSLVVATRKAAPHTLVKTIPANEATEEGMRRLAAQLFADSGPGSSRETMLVVETNVTEGTILVDGVARGTVSGRRGAILRGLPPGEARVSIEAPGYASNGKLVTIRDGGDPARASITLSPLPAGGPVALVPVTAPAPMDDTSSAPGQTARVLFWSSLVATGAGVAAFTITGLQVRSIEKEQDGALANFDYMMNGVQFPDDACAEAKNDGYAALDDICGRGRRMATITNVLIGVSAAAAVATAIFYWRGYLAPGRSSEQMASKKKKPPKLVWSPEFYPNGAGLGAVIQF